MKKILAFALAGFAATAAYAGEKPVVYYIYTDVPVTSTDTPTYIELTTVKSVQGVAGSTVSAPGKVGQASLRLGNQDVAYARLLKEAKKRGLR